MIEKNISSGLIFNRRSKLITGNITSKYAFTLVFAFLMCISANSFVYLPFTPVPVTMQVFTVLLSAIMLGRHWAVLSQVQYILLGILGLPVFAGFKSGPAVLWGPTGGYIAGFIAGAFITGYIYDKYKEKRTCLLKGTYIYKSLKQLKNFLPLTILFFACLAGLVTIYLAGYINLTGFFYIYGTGTKTAAGVIVDSFKLGVAPFIIADMIKIAIILNIYKLKGSYEEN